MLNWTERGLLVAIVVVVALTTLVDADHNYLSRPVPSARDIVRQVSLLGIFALGAAVVIIAGGIDLSIGSVVSFSGSMCAVFLVLLAPEAMKSGTKGELGTGVIALAIGLTLVVGLLIGSLHAWLITVIELPPFVATLATLVGLRSLGRAIVEQVTAAQLSGKSTQIQIYDTQFLYLEGSIWIPAALFVFFALAVWVLLSRTVTGRHLYALGGNEQAARLSGIRTDRLKWLAYCTSAVLSSVAGIIYVSGQSVADPQTLGRGYELNAIAAAVVGGCSLQGGVGTVLGTVLGVIFLRVVMDGVAKVIKTGADLYEGLLVGGVIVIAVALSQLRTALTRGKDFFPGLLGITAIVNLSLINAGAAALLGPNLLRNQELPRLWLGAGAAALTAILLGGAKAVQYSREKTGRGRGEE